MGADQIVVSAGLDRVTAELEKVAAAGIAVLHRRRMPRAVGVIDHLVVTRGAVWVVSVPPVTGYPQLRVSHRFLRSRTERLVVDGADGTALLDGVQALIDGIETRFPEFAVRGVACFDTDRSGFGGSFNARGVDVVVPAKLAKLLGSTAEGRIDVTSAASLLGHAFPPA